MSIATQNNYSFRMQECNACNILLDNHPSGAVYFEKTFSKLAISEIVDHLSVSNNNLSPHGKKNLIHVVSSLD